MGATPDKLKSEIEATREELSNTVNALAEKVSPARITKRRLRAVKETATGMKDKVVTGAAGGAGTVSDRAGSVAGAATDAPGALAAQARGNPLPAALLALGAGAVVANLLPKTTGEQRVAAAMNDSGLDVMGALKQTASESGRQLKDTLAPQAQQAVTAVKERAGAAVEATKQETQTAADDVSTHGQKAARTVKSQAQTAKQRTVSKTTSRTTSTKASDVHVVHKDGSWVVEQKGSGVISTHSTQALAEQAGRRRARRDRTEFVLHGRNGRIRAKDSYGNDPRGRG
jgi:hypothetical protein